MEAPCPSPHSLRCLPLSASPLWLPSRLMGRQGSFSSAVNEAHESSPFARAHLGRDQHIGRTGAGAGAGTKASAARASAGPTSLVPRAAQSPGWQVRGPLGRALLLRRGAHQGPLLRNARGLVSRCPLARGGQPRRVPGAAGGTTEAPQQDLSEGKEKEQALGDSISDFTRFYEDPSRGIAELQTSTVSYWKPGPWWDLLRPEVQVDLVSVVHIGDKEYYEGLQEELCTYDRVLFEMVADSSQKGKSRGGRARAREKGRGVEGKETEKRRDLARALAGHPSKSEAAEAGQHLGTMKEEVPSSSTSRKEPPSTPRAKGKWGEGKKFVGRSAFALRSRRRRGFSFVSFIQRVMASSMQLSFQLDHIDYSVPTFRNADLDYQTFARLQSERSESIFSIARDVSIKSTKAVMATMKTLSGTPDTALAQSNLGIVRRVLLWAAGTLPMPLLGLLLIDSVCHPPGSRNAIREQLAVRALLNLDVASALKVFLAQQMGSDALDVAASIMEESVIVGERNKAAMAEVHRALDDGCRRIAVFYGSAHLPDLHRRLGLELGMRPVAVRWRTAWSILGRRKRWLQSGGWEEVRGVPQLSYASQGVAANDLRPWLPVELPQEWPLSRSQTLALMLFSLVLALDLWLWELLIEGVEQSAVQAVTFIATFLDKGWSL